MKPLLLASTLAFSVIALPALAKDCNGLKQDAMGLLRKGSEINQQIAGLDPADPDYAKKKKDLREKFRRVRNDFYVIQVHYGSPPPCGSGDLEDDLGKSFPPMGNT